MCRYKIKELKTQTLAREIQGRFWLQLNGSNFSDLILTHLDLWQNVSNAHKFLACWTGKEKAAVRNTRSQSDSKHNYGNIFAFVNIFGHLSLECSPIDPVSVLLARKHIKRKLHFAR